MNTAAGWHLSVRRILGGTVAAVVAVTAVAVAPAASSAARDGGGRSSPAPAPVAGPLDPPGPAEVDPALVGAEGGVLAVIVRATDEAVATAAVEAIDGTVTRPLPIVHGVAADVPASALDALAATPGVIAVSADTPVHVAQVAASGGSAGSVHRQVVGADAAQRAGLTGKGVTVALVDTGIADVPDLRGRVVSVVDPLTGRKRPCQDFSGERGCEDSYGHGTFLAGLIAGTGASSGGALRGVAPGAKLVSVKVAGADGSADVSTVLGAIQWVVSYKDRYGIDVLNLSLGTNGRQSYRVDPFNYAVERAWHAGITVVVAAGNLGPDAGTVSKPADDPWVISVGAIDDRGTRGLGDDVVPDFSGRGPARDGVGKPDVVAPGGHLVSLAAPGSTIDRQYASDGPAGYRRGSGTSMSAAVTSGVAALVREARPRWEPDKVKAALVGTARAAASDRREAVGAGVVDAAAAAAWTGRGRANVGLDRSNGTGLLDASRGTVRVQVAGVLPVVVQGQLTAQLILWDPLGFLLRDWDGRTWLSTGWVTSGLLRTTWYGDNWHGHNWHGADWYGHDVPATYGRPGPGAAWYGAWD